MRSVDIRDVDDVVRLGDEIDEYTGGVSKRVENLTSKEYILSVGTIEFRKTISFFSMLIDAY